jgi:hypothetical protein
MIKGIDSEVASYKCFLVHNGNSLFALDKIVPRERLAEALANGGAETIPIYCALAEQGELVRRYLGYTPREYPTSEALSLLCGPADIPKMAADCMDAIMLGFGRETLSGVKAGVVDRGLAELEAQEARDNPKQ